MEFIYSYCYVIEKSTQFPSRNLFFEQFQEFFGINKFRAMSSKFVNKSRQVKFMDLVFIVRGYVNRSQAPKGIASHHQLVLFIKFPKIQP